LVYRVLDSPGRALPEGVAGEFGGRLQTDLSPVRIHDDADADQSARSVGARAYAVGSHLVFRTGGFRPDATEGRELLAHELAHAAREGGRPRPTGHLAIGAPDDVEEREADRLARDGLSPAVATPGAATAPGAVVRRQPEQPQDQPADPWADYDVVQSAGTGCDEELIEEYCPLDPEQDPPALSGADPRVGDRVQASCRVVYESADASARAKARRQVLLATDHPPQTFVDDNAEQIWWGYIKALAETEESALSRLGQADLVQVPSAFPATAARAYRSRRTLQVDQAALQAEQVEAQREVREAGITMGIYLQGQGIPPEGAPPFPFLGQVADELQWPHYLRAEGVVGDLARAVLRHRTLLGPSRFVQDYNRGVENEAAAIDRGESCPPEGVLAESELGQRATISFTAVDAWAVLAGELTAMPAGLQAVAASALLALRQIATAPEDYQGRDTYDQAVEVADGRVAAESGIERLFDAIDIGAYQGYFGKAKDDLVAGLKENWMSILAVAGITIGVSLIPGVGWIIGAVLAVFGVAKTIIDVALAIRRCLNATTLYELQKGAKELAAAAVAAGFDALITAVTWGAGRAWRAWRGARGAKAGVVPEPPPPAGGGGGAATLTVTEVAEETATMVRAGSRQRIAELTPGELDTELSAVARSRSQGRIGAHDEVPLPNKHAYETDEGLVWCRHSNGGGCLLPGIRGTQAPAERVFTPAQDARFERMWDVLDDHGLDWARVFRDRAEAESFLAGFADNEAALHALERRVGQAIDRHGALAEQTDVAGVKRSGGMTEFEEQLTGAQLRAVESGPAVGGGSLPELDANWLAGTRARMVSRIPGQIARRMRSMTFRNWRDFRETFWRLVAQDSQLSPNFSAANRARMASGRAPFVIGEEAVGGRANAVYQINHTRPLEQGGSLFDMDYLEIITPRVHQALGDQ
jgi:hypothetical protein